jgi:hypothetical protein
MGLMCFKVFQSLTSLAPVRCLGHDCAIDLSDAAMPGESYAPRCFPAIVFFVFSLEMEYVIVDLGST